jgi:predicted TIM-barrel fold metal-dependent hydrolase
MGTNPEIAKQGKVPEAIGQTVALAKYPNVSVKVSNLQSSSLEPYPHRDLTEHIRRVFDAYGPQRCYWGSDVTSGYARVNWRQRLAHVTETLDFMSEQDKDWVLGRALLQRLKWA